MLSSLAVWAGPAFADPPAHAPAHGWRKKHDPYYVGYTGVSWERDYDISSGRCNRQEIATVVGAIAGGAIANHVADEHKAVATIVGVIAGGVIGNRIGKELDEADRGCFGHALELAEPGRAVRWINDRTHVDYVLTPLGMSDTKNCRKFKLQAKSGKKSKTSEGRACRDGDGVWRIG